MESNNGGATRFSDLSATLATEKVRYLYKFRYIENHKLCLLSIIYQL